MMVCQFCAAICIAYAHMLTLPLGVILRVLTGCERDAFKCLQRYKPVA